MVSTNTVSLANSSKETEIASKVLPFHLSLCVGAATRHFYCDILGIEERRASKTSVHFDFYGSQLTVHEIEGFAATSLQREVDAEDVPVPHFGVALPFKEWEKVAERLLNYDIHFVSRPHLRFLGKGHEQFVLFVEDPSGHGIEIKSFTMVPAGEWA
jgi:uncharacterized protein